MQPAATLTQTQLHQTPIEMHSMHAVLLVGAIHIYSRCILFVFASHVIINQQKIAFVCVVLCPVVTSMHTHLQCQKSAFIGVHGVTIYTKKADTDLDIAIQIENLGRNSQKIGQKLRISQSICTNGLLNVC